MSHTYFQRLKKSIKARFFNQETLAALIFLIGMMIAPTMKTFGFLIAESARRLPQ